MEVIESLVLNVLVPVFICILYDKRIFSLSVAQVMLFSTHAHCAGLMLFPSSETPSCASPCRLSGAEQVLSPPGAPAFCAHDSVCVCSLLSSCSLSED